MSVVSLGLKKSCCNSQSHSGNMLASRPVKACNTGCPLSSSDTSETCSMKRHFHIRRDMCM